MDSAKSNWERIYKHAGNTPPPTDDWLDKYMPLIKVRAGLPIIDLGCGFGNDTLYLDRKGYRAISCDYSEEALARLNHFIEKPECRYVDMCEKLPFESDSAQVIICDLSLHYFDEKTTRAVVSEIKRVLKPNGALLCRVNSLDEMANEEAEMTKIGHNFYRVGFKQKRYFGKEDVQELFDGFKIGDIYEYTMLRYKKPKYVLDFAVIKAQ